MLFRGIRAVVIGDGGFRFIRFFEEFSVEFFFCIVVVGIFVGEGFLMVFVRVFLSLRRFFC